jgi:hypothetical protein
VFEFLWGTRETAKQGGFRFKTGIPAGGTVFEFLWGHKRNRQTRRFSLYDRDPRRGIFSNLPDRYMLYTILEIAETTAPAGF